MTGKFRPEVDSFLYHLIGDEKSIPAHRARLKELEQESRGSGDEAEFALEAIVYRPSTEDIGESEFGAELGTELPSYEHGIPVLVQVRRMDWTGENIAGFQRSTQLGDVVTGHADVAAIQALAADDDVIRVDVSRDAGSEELSISIPAVRADAVHSGPSHERGAHALIGVIDGGLDVLHECFRDSAGKTRIIAVWDQTDNSGTPPTDASGRNLYGTLHTAADINSYIAQGAVPTKLGQSQEHGTHVASIAAGRAIGAFAGGMAPEAGIVFVRPKLRTPQGDPTSIGYSMGHIDALAFIDQIARREGKPIAVNVSLGMNAGAHDGSSSLEASFDNFTASGRLAGRAIVKSAGNSGEQGLHAKLTLGSFQQTDLEWDRGSGPQLVDTIELWYNSADDFSFVLLPPGGGAGSAKVGRTPDLLSTGGVFPNGNAYSITLDRYFRDNGDARLLVQVKVGGANAIAPGTWKLRISARSVTADGVVHAWIERSDRQKIAFTAANVSIDGSLSIPGTARHVITVAALDRASDGQVMSFSSRGGTRDGRNSPDVSAPGDSIEAAAARSGTGIVASSGTSMAAPHVTGAIALLFSQQQAKGGPQLNSNQIRAALQQSSRGYNGRWNSARGWGMLDTEALLKLFQ